MKKYEPIILEINNALKKFNSLFIQKEHVAPFLDEKELSNKSFFFNLIDTHYDDGKWPNDFCKGVYFIFGVNEKNESENGIYIGKANNSNKIGRRLYHHLDKYKNEDHFYMNGRERRYIVELVSSISLEGKPAYMADWVEAFLIAELKQKNIILMNYTGN